MTSTNNNNNSRTSATSGSNNNKPISDENHQYRKTISNEKLVLTSDEEYASLTPAMSGSDYEALKQSIEHDGQYIPIDTNEDGVVLDGHHRYRACQELGIDPKINVKKVENRLLEKIWIIEVNRNRRHLTPFQRIELQSKLEVLESELAKERMSNAGKIGAAKRWQEKVESNEETQCGSIENGVIQNNTTPSDVPNLKENMQKERRGRVIDISAQKAQVSPTTYYRGRKIIRQTPSPEILDTLRAGKISINKAFKQLENQRSKQEFLSNLANPSVQLPEQIKLEEGDFVEKCKTLPPKSFDLIFTDPPYKVESLPLYGDLANAAAILLKDGASLVTYCGQDLKYQVIELMKSSGLTYWWEIAIIQASSSARMFTKNVVVTWKPLLWFVNGTKLRISEFIKDSVHSPRPDKTFHTWTQSTAEAEHVISKLTNENDVVLDPMMGTGTTGIASLNLKRQFIGIEKDAETFKIAKARLESTFSGAK